jgi:hypothetical protein
MSMTWAQIRMAFLQAAGDSEQAREEAALHVSEGYREIAAGSDVPELAAIDSLVPVPAGVDYTDVAAVDFSVYALLDAYNVTGGYPLYPEPGGMTGRNRFMGTTGIPPLGTITNYQRDGGRIYWRNTPASDAQIRLRVRLQTPTITLAADTLNESPITPAQYDMAIVWAAAESYYTLHPKNEVDGAQAPTPLSQKYRDAKQAKLSVVVNPRVEEDRAHSEVMRLRGYRMRRGR